MTLDLHLHASLNTVATQALLFEQISTQLKNQAEALKRDGLDGPPVEDLLEARGLVRRQANRMKREAGRMLKATPVGEFVGDTLGLGDAVAIFVGLLPPLDGFANPAKVWAYCGLCPGKGPKKGEDHRYSRKLKSHAIKRLADPCMKQAASPYRTVYDERRERTAITHPEWTDGHSHNDALRITAKAILLDIWRASRGLPPRVGHYCPDTRRGGATVGAESANTSTGDGAKLPLAPTSRLPHRHTYRDEGGGQDTHDAHSWRAPALAYSTEEA